MTDNDNGAIKLISCGMGTLAHLIDCSGLIIISISKKCIRIVSRILRLKALRCIFVSKLLTKGGLSLL